MTNGVRHTALMHLPKFRCCRIVGAAGQRIFHRGKRAVIKPAGALKPPLALDRSGHNEMPHCPDEESEKKESKNNQQKPMDPTGKRRQDSEQGDRQKQTSRTDRRVLRSTR